MGVYNNIAKDMILKEQNAIHESEEKLKNSYKTGLFYGGAEVLVIAKNADEAERFEKLAIADYQRLKNKVDKKFTVRESIDHYEYDGNDFTVVMKESDKFSFKDNDEDWDDYRKEEQRKDKEEDEKESTNESATNFSEYNKILKRIDIDDIVNNILDGLSTYSAKDSVPSKYKEEDGKIKFVYMNASWQDYCDQVEKEDRIEAGQFKSKIEKIISELNKKTPNNFHFFIYNKDNQDSKNSNKFDEYKIGCSIKINN